MPGTLWSGGLRERAPVGMSVPARRRPGVTELHNRPVFRAHGLPVVQFGNTRPVDCESNSASHGRTRIR
ncbi:MAG TPA: hypothetical protein VK735_19385, partial [Pseudonocardia sp.]|uniref:hypothetical protein n=1 Tax=Pseudonocardia sp. TaxID=60912 RepID=UPI002C14B707